MRSLFYFLWVVCLSAVATQLGVAQTGKRKNQSPTTTLTNSRLQVLDSALTKLHEQGMLNGVVLVAEQGRVVYKKVVGTANIQTNEPLTSASAFNLGSISKQFMAVLIMQLQEKGKLRYDDPVTAYLPDFPYAAITIRQLLTHTNGLPEYGDIAQQVGGPLDTLTNEGMLAMFRDHKPALRFAPGSQWEYSNTGYVILGSIIKAVTGKPVEAVLDEQIARPLGLTNTYAYYLNSRTKPRNRVYGFVRNNGVNQSNDLIRLDGVIGDGNVYASADDLLLWDQALYTQKLVKASTLQEAFTPVRLTNGSTYPYGFGWFLNDNGQTLVHTGSWVGFRNDMVRKLPNQQTIICLTSGTDATARQITRAIMDGKPVTLPTTQLITNIRLIDGTGLSPRSAAVRLRDAQIWEVGQLSPFAHEPVVDGKGLVLAPGFIDSHSHHFSSLQKNPEGLPLLSQGVTSIVIGQDGSSYAIDTIQAQLTRQPTAVNVATYTGHSTLRTSVMGARGLYRTAKPDEVQQMKKRLQRDMQLGSLGLATGLEYESAFFSNRDEVLQLAQVAADSGGRYISHIRSEDINLADAIDEVIQIGRITKMPVQISHIKIAQRNQWGQSAAWLAQLEKARAEGISITADCYPYDFWLSTLRVLFPKRDYTNPESAEFAVNQLFDPTKSVLARYGANPGYAGKTLSEIAGLRQQKPAQALMGLIAEAEAFAEKNPDQGGESIMGKSMDEQDVVNFLQWPQTNICSDGSVGGHPRAFGAFTRVLGRYVREQKIMPLETAIYKMTGLTAQHLGLSNRGLIAPGYAADLVLLNPDTVQDNARLGDSQALSTGIEAVWVNGRLVYQNQKPTGVFPGVFIRRK